jgi:AcrR family transcriptional regulator
VSSSDHRLPPGRHGLNPEFVAENQRWRLIAAATEILAERGYAGTTARRIATRAAVSPTAFYRYFANVPAVITASSEIAARAFFEVVSQACRSTREPPGLEAALEAALFFVSEEPQLANLLGGEPAAAVAEIEAVREGLLDDLSALVASCVDPAPRGGRPALAAVLALAVAGQATVACLPELAELLSGLWMAEGG